MSSSCGKKATVPTSKKRKGASSSSGPTAKICHPFLQSPIGPQEELFQILRDRPLIVGYCIDWAAVERVQLADEFKEENDLHALNCHIHRSPSRCWDALVPRSATYDRSRSKGRERAPALSPLMTSNTYGVCHTGMSSTSPTLSPLQFATRQSKIERGPSLWPLCDSTGATLRAPRHRGTRIILDPHWPNVSTRHLEHAKHEND
ncbi:hypothetical protein GOBAR_AA35118 [Gossypium barbadense]|uniref:Uncharacterized protein n=1 Tax=Gossypium barbadense TaxID=3634 RepID=A0A2P5W3A6_GOSBA|nr:hypothetical protein GOBAR_AA35118 [Gossypium barbadense]